MAERISILESITNNTNEGITMLQTKEITKKENVHEVQVWIGTEYVCSGIGETIEGARQIAWDGYAIMKRKGEL